MKKGHYNRLRVVLAELEIPQKELAKGLDVGRVTVSRWCSNEQQPSIENLYRIANYLGVEVRELLIQSKGR
jgi:transcriptional regulator with XRE-family HTH domain